MKKQISAALAAVLIATTLIPSQSFAIVAVPPLVIVAVPPPPPPPSMAHGGSGGAGGAGAAAGGIIGIAAFLAGYDLIRRTTCSGDFLYLGGPGFTEPMPNGNVMIPQCPLLHNFKHKRR